MTQKNCNSLKKMQKIRTQRKALRPGLLFGPHGLKKNMGYSPNIVSYEAKERDKKLQKFFAEVRKKDGSDYEPDSHGLLTILVDGCRESSSEVQRHSGLQSPPVSP